MRKNNRTARKNKGQIALYFPKWYLCTRPQPKRQITQISKHLGGKLK